MFRRRSGNNEEQQLKKLWKPTGGRSFDDPCPEVRNSSHRSGNLNSPEVEDYPNMLFIRLSTACFKRDSFWMIFISLCLWARFSLRITFYSTQQNQPTGKRRTIPLSKLANNTIESIARHTKVIWDVEKKQISWFIARFEPRTLESQADIST